MARQNFKVSAAVDSLHMSRPGVSKQIQPLEDALQGGEKVFRLTQRAICDIENIRKVG